MAQQAYDPLAPVPCPYCGDEARALRGYELYGRERCLEQNWDRLYYRCDPCDAHVGCHPDGRPMGPLADPSLRRHRQEAHWAFDQRWRYGARADWKRQRREAYRWLQGELGLPEDLCHIGMFDEATCRRVMELCEGPDPLLAEDPTPGHELRVRAFVGARCCLGSTLVVPLRVLWHEYRDYCATRGEVANAQDLRSALEAAPWARVEQRAFGLLRTVVHGVGVKPR